MRTVFADSGYWIALWNPEMPSAKRTFNEH